MSKSHNTDITKKNIKKLLFDVSDTQLNQIHNTILPYKPEKSYRKEKQEIIIS